MAIANQIAQYGMNTGNNIQNTVSNAFARIENNRRYEQEQNIKDMMLDKDDIAGLVAIANKTNLGESMAIYDLMNELEQKVS